MEAKPKRKIIGTIQRSSPGPSPNLAHVPTTPKLSLPTSSSPSISSRPRLTPTSSVRGTPTSVTLNGHPPKARSILSASTGSTSGSTTAKARVKVAPSSIIGAPASSLGSPSFPSGSSSRDYDPGEAAVGADVVGRGFRSSSPVGSNVGSLVSGFGKVTSKARSTVGTPTNTVRPKAVPGARSYPAVSGSIVPAPALPSIQSSKQQSSSTAYATSSVTGSPLTASTPASSTSNPLNGSTAKSLVRARTTPNVHSPADYSTFSSFARTSPGVSSPSNQPVSGSFSPPTSSSAFLNPSRVQSPNIPNPYHTVGPSAKARPMSSLPGPHSPNLLSPTSAKYPVDHPNLSPIASSTYSPYLSSESPKLPPLSPSHYPTTGSFFSPVLNRTPHRRSFDSTSTLSSDSPDESSAHGESSSFSEISGVQPSALSKTSDGHETSGRSQGGVMVLEGTDNRLNSGEAHSSETARTMDRLGDEDDMEDGVEKEEAKVNRKVADLEISNASLLNINHALEATKAKQAKEIRDLRRKVRTGSVQPLPPLNKRLRALTSPLLSTSYPFPAPLPSSSEGSGDDESEEEESDDEQFVRIKEVMLGLLEQAVQAVQQPRPVPSWIERDRDRRGSIADGLEKSVGGKVLGILEMDEYRARKEEEEDDNNDDEEREEEDAQQSASLDLGDQTLRFGDLSDSRANALRINLSDEERSMML
ncbi:hypothetical protein [Phaffia rhodozyma]|uniref:Uncharacterized protein n=1 Tax=Phaffia rhodozyma TaxID=264483 RepID=A0A0F7SU37_PHARH|nr:hypothetical protein [Phaffia rhodozyma]